MHLWHTWNHRKPITCTRIILISLFEAITDLGKAIRWFKSQRIEHPLDYLLLQKPLFMQARSRSLSGQQRAVCSSGLFQYFGALEGWLGLLALEMFSNLNSNILHSHPQWFSMWQWKLKSRTVSADLSHVLLQCHTWAWGTREAHCVTAMTIYKNQDQPEPIVWPWFTEISYNCRNHKRVPWEWVVRAWIDVVDLGVVVCTMH